MARTAILTLAILLVTAASAYASEVGHDAGEGWYGPLNDKVITNANFIVIALFPLIALTFSLIQWRLDKRKERRKAAVKARAGSPEWSGGW